MLDVYSQLLLSPLLFNIFSNDIRKALLADASNVVYDTKVNHLLYADDLVLLSTKDFKRILIKYMNTVKCGV